MVKKLSSTSYKGYSEIIISEIEFDFPAGDEGLA